MVEYAILILEQRYGELLIAYDKLVVRGTVKETSQAAIDNRRMRGELMTAIKILYKENKICKEE